MLESLHRPPAAPDRAPVEGTVGRWDTGSGCHRIRGHWETLAATRLSDMIAAVLPRCEPV